MLKAFSLVFGKKRYGFTSILLFFVVFIAFALLPNTGALLSVFMSDFASLGFKLQFLIKTIISFISVYPFLSVFSTILISFLIALNIGLIVFLLRRKFAGGKAITLSSFGTLGGVFGLGCFTCGSLVGGAVLSFFGISASVVSVGGIWFDLVAIVLLLGSLLYNLHIVRQKEGVCSI